MRHESRREAGTRIAAALHEHARRVGIDPEPPDAVVLSGADGRTALRSGKIDVSRHAWDQRLRAPFSAVQKELHDSGRAVGHPLLLPSGEAYLMRPGALPIDQEVLWERIAGPPHDDLPPKIVQVLVDRILWELGVMLTFELVGDRLETPNPYAPLLTVYEEGLYPLDIGPERALLWAPSV